MSAEVEHTDLPNGRSVSTRRTLFGDVHLGAAFETLVFGGGRQDFAVLEVVRSATEAQARECHRLAVLRWQPQREVAS